MGFLSPHRSQKQTLSLGRHTEAGRKARSELRISLHRMRRDNERDYLDTTFSSVPGPLANTASECCGIPSVMVPWLFPPLWSWGEGSKLAGGLKHRDPQGSGNSTLLQ